MKEYESHPAAKLFPMMDNGEMAELVADIKAHGLVYPITLHEGMILDGRNRFVACKQAKVDPRFTDWDANGSSPTEWVLSVNFHRRQLTVSQRAAIAVNSLPMLEAEAKGRQSKNATAKNTGVPNKEIIPDSEKGQARDKAAKIANVNPRYVSDAKKIKEKSHEVFKQVESGEKTIPQAKRQLFGGGEVVAEEVVQSRAAEAEKDSEKLWALKSAWRSAGKRDRAAFVTWIKSKK